MTTWSVRALAASASPLASLSAAACAVLLTVGACTPPPPPTSETRAAQAVMTACRERANEVYRRQNRADLLNQDSSGTPQSANYVPGIPTRGLAERYGYQNQVSNCLRDEGASVDTVPNAVGGAAAPLTHTGQPK